MPILLLQGVGVQQLVNSTIKPIHCQLNPEEL